MKAYFLSTVTLGIDVINLLKNDIEIKGIIGLSERSPGDEISGYCYMSDYCKQNGIDFIEVESYSLNNPTDQKCLLSLDIDFLIVSGWQRLVPQWLIQHVKYDVIGIHGSPFGITQGRGRSPQNWALIMGLTEFYISIFKIDQGVDSGDIIDELMYEISCHDDIGALYNKLCWTSAEMIRKVLKQGKTVTKLLASQDSEPRYLPQRLPEDGAIDWNRSSEDIFNFIRALTRPYPGAFSLVDQSDTEVVVWSCKPFDPGFNIPGRPGEILKIYTNGSLLIKTRDSGLQIDEYTFPGKEALLKEGTMLKSVNFRQQLKGIIERHLVKYPAFPVNEALIELTK